MRTAVRFFVLLLAAGVLASCGSEPLGPADADDVAAARARWVALGARNYEYVSGHACFCDSRFVGPLLTVVENGVVVRVEDAGTGEPRPLTWRPTIDGWFDFLEREATTRPQDLTGAFDRTTGVPIGFVYGTPANDGGGIVRFRRFRVLTP